MIGMELGVAVGVLIVMVTWVRQACGKPTPSWILTAGALVVVVAARRSLTGLSEVTTPAQWATTIDASGRAGLVLAVLGATGILVSLGLAFWGRTRPSLVTGGLLMTVAGLFWYQWSIGEAALWRMAGQPFEQIESQRQAADEALRALLPWGIGMVMMTVPTTIWSVRRHGWRALGEGVASGTLVLLVMGTGQPSRDAVHHAAGKYATRCAPVPDLLDTRPAGHIPYDGRTFVRMNPSGRQHFDVTGWKDGWPHDQPLALVASSNVPLDTIATWVGGYRDVQLAGWTPPPAAPQLYDHHPVVLASRCSLHPLPSMSPETIP